LRDRGPQGRVAAFEPNEFTRGLLRRNAVGRPNIDVVGRAVGAGAASTTFRVPEFADIAFATLAGEDRLDGNADQSWVSQPVEEMSLDAYVAESGLTPTVIKLDVENNEGAALDGMEEILARQRPILILELGDIGTESGRSRGLLDRILALAYRAFEAAPDLTLQAHTPASSYGYMNLMFVPAERVEVEGRTVALSRG
jgi:FkbM family methyltransferase